MRIIHTIIGIITAQDPTTALLSVTTHDDEVGLKNDTVHRGTTHNREKSTSLTLIKQSCQKISASSRKKARKASGNDKDTYYGFCFVSYFLQRTTKAI